MKIKNHDDFPSLITAPLPLSGQSGIGWSIRRPSPGRAPGIGGTINWGILNGTSGENYSGINTGRLGGRP